MSSLKLGQQQPLEPQPPRTCWRRGHHKYRIKVGGPGLTFPGLGPPRSAFQNRNTRRCHGEASRFPLPGAPEEDAFGNEEKSGHERPANDRPLGPNNLES